MFSYQLINHPESFMLDESRIARVFELVSIVPICSRHPEKVNSSEGGKEVTLGCDRKDPGTSFGNPGSFVPQDDGNQQNGILNIAFLPDEEIQILNRDHRGIDKTTDVLSFHYYEDFAELRDDDVAGEIILSESRILAQALEHQHSPQKETEILVLHSILHIMGYDHETDEDYTRMWKWESELRAKL